MLGDGGEGVGEGNDGTGDEAEANFFGVRLPGWSAGYRIGPEYTISGRGDVRDAGAGQADWMGESAF